MAAGSKARSARIDLAVGLISLERGLSDAERKLRGFGRNAKAAVDGGGLRKLGGGILSGLGALAGIGGGIGLASIADDVVNVERALTRFQIATDGTAETTARLRADLARVSRATGVNRGELLAGAAGYVALTGDAAGAAASVELFGRVANATGAEVADLAAVAAALKDNLGIDPADFEAGFSALHVQGKAGAIELRELATLLASVAPSFAAFKGGSGAGGLAEMGAALQVVRKGFSSGAEAATGMRALMVSMQRSAGKFQKAGIQIYDKDPATGKKRLRDFSDIVDGIANSKLAKDPTALTKAFGSDEAKRAYDQLVANRALLDDLITKSGDRGAIERDAATYQESSAGRIAAAWNDIKLTVAEAFTPDRIKSFAAAMEQTAKAVMVIASIVEKFMNFGTSSHNDIEDYRSGQQGERRSLDLMRRGIAEGAPITQAAAQARVVQEQMVYDDVLRGRAKPDEVLGAAAQGGDVWAKLGAIVDARAAAGAAGPSTVNVTVKIGENTVAQAQAQAAGHRTRPGGV